MVHPSSSLRTFIWSGFVAGALGIAAAGDWEFAQTPGLATGAPRWLAAVALLAAAAWWGDRDDVATASWRWSRQDWWAFLSIAVVSLLFHLWRVTTYPPADAFAFEEFQTGGLAFHVYEDWTFSLEFPLTNFLPGVSFRLFGLNSFALRAPFVLCSAAASLLVFAALRRLVALPAAWAAAMLLASSRWAAAASRFADEIFFPIGVVAASAWLLVRAVQSRGQKDAVVFAVLSSDLLYAYSGYRVFPLVVIGGGFIEAVAAWRRGGWQRRFVRPVILVAAIWAIALSPGVLGWYFYGDNVLPEAFLRHADDWKSEGLPERLESMLYRLRLGWEVFVVRGDEIPSVNVPYWPMVDPITGALATMSVLAAARRWRQPARRWTLLAFGAPFAALAVIPGNVNISRYFVLLVPLYMLIGFLADDAVRWRKLGPWVPRALVCAVVLAGVVNFVQLEQLIDHPAVQASFRVAENTVLAAIHRVPIGAKAVLLVVDGRNAFEPSDYRWYTAHVVGRPADSLRDAVSGRFGETGPVYWITQFAPEAELVPSMIALVCPNAVTTIDRAPDPYSTVGSTWVPAHAGCEPLPPFGLHAQYASTDAAGAVTRSGALDPALTAYTIPVSLATKLADGQLGNLQVDWQGLVLPTSPGLYSIRVEVMGASASLQAGGDEATTTSLTGGWESARLQVSMNADPVRIAVRLTAHAGAFPRVRLYWTAPGGAERLIPPTQLRPASE